MNNQMDDEIEALLRDQFDGPAAPDDFCERVMAQLPAGRRFTIGPVTAGAFTGVVMCWGSLWSAPIARIAWRDWLSGELSASAFVLFSAMMILALLALAWTFAEADDRTDPASAQNTR